MIRNLAMFFVVIQLSACGNNLPGSVADIPGLAPVGQVQEDGSVVHGQAVISIHETTPSSVAKVFQFLFPQALAASGSSTVTYTNAASTNFTLNTSLLSASGMSGGILSLGSATLASLSDNNLKVCGSGGNTKCTGAVIRVYTTGSIAGFVNTADGYGAPVYSGNLNPNTPIGLTPANSVVVANAATISPNKHTISLSDFPNPTYSVTSDFSNAGAGAYSMVFVVEYALLP